MMPMTLKEQAPVPPPPYHRAQARLSLALHIDALACGLPRGKDDQPRIPCPSQQWKRGHQAGAPLPEARFVLCVLTALRRRLIGARDLIIDSAPVLAWRRADP